MSRNVLVALLMALGVLAVRRAQTQRNERDLWTEAGVAPDLR